MTRAYLLPLISGAETGAWIAAIAGALALSKQGWDALKKRKQENLEIEDALNKAPEVKKQLELGNIGEAVTHLNAIIQSQNDHIKSQDDRLRKCDDEIQRQRDRLEAAEAEADAWEIKYNDLKTQHEIEKGRHSRQIADLTERMEAQKRSFARTLAQLRGTQEEGDGDDKQVGQDPTWS